MSQSIYHIYRGDSMDIFSFIACDDVYTCRLKNNNTMRAQINYEHYMK